MLPCTHRWPRTIPATLEQGRGQHLLPLVSDHLQALLKPVAHGVLRGEILSRGLPHRRRRGESVLLPLEATVDHPLQDLRPLGLELFGKLGIPLSAGIVTVKGTRLNRRLIASSTVFREGL